MSGGTAYVWDPRKEFATKCNMGTVDLESVDEDEDIGELRELIEQHREFTRSPVAERILDRWPEVLGEFVKVMPIDHKRVLQERRRHDEEMESSVKEDGTGRLRAIEH
jgi:glutamate synthase domain-containing protein 3